MRFSRWFGTTTIAVLASASIGFAQVTEMEMKKREEMGLAPGVVIDQSNAQLVDGLVPPEILDYYKKGEWKNTVAQWPEGGYKYDDEFLKHNEENAKYLEVSAEGAIVDKRTGQPPDYIYGYPFPNIDPNDPNAGLKIVWNQNYMIYAHLTNAKFYVDIVWLSRQGVDRVARQQVFFKYFDGQKKKYLDKENPQNILQQYIAAAESPQDLYGTTALQWRFKTGKRDLMWTYIPALRRIRAVSPANRSDGFLGSDISQDDGPFFDGLPSDFTWKLVGDGEVLRLADPFSLKGEVGRTPQPDGSFRESIRTDVAVFGAQDPNWKGVPWAPVTPVLVKRPVWIVEGVPKDKYYLYGKIQLMVDKESFNGAYNRKFSWQGEHLHDYIPTAFLTHKSITNDGDTEYFWGGAIQFFSGINFKNDRASNVSFPPGTFADRHYSYKPNFFDYQTLYRFGQ